MPYAELEDLQAYIPNYQAKPEYDKLLVSCLNRATKLIENYTNRTFAAESDTTRYFDAVQDVNWHNGRGFSAYGGGDVPGYTLFLDEDLCQITSITNGDGKLVLPNQYTTMERNRTPWFAIKLKLNADTIWTWNDTPEEAISITGRWSYSIEPPDDIVQACLRWAAYLYKQRDAQVFDVTADAKTGMMTIPKGIPADVKQMLQSYVRLA